MTLPAVNPHADAFYQDPYPAYALLRAEAPVYEVPDVPGLYFVTTWALVREALMAPDRFGNSMPAARRSEPPAEVADEVARLRAQGFPYVPALGTNDPPQHTRYRRLVNRAFTVRSLAWMEPLVDDVADQLVAALPEDETVEAMAALTIPLPVWAIMRILGLGEERRDDIRRWSESATAALGGLLTAERWVQTEEDMLDFQTVMSAELDARRAEPRDDLLSALVQPDGDEEPLTNAELVWLVRELIVAGNETTTRALGDMIVRFGDQPEAWAELRESEDLRRRYVEEGIRLSSPAMGLWRRVLHDTELGGVHLPEGSTVFLAYGSANRDDAVFDRPDEFDPLREDIREHLAFGHGIHVCVGAGLARIEASSALRALAEQVEWIEVVDRAALRYGPSYALRGLVELPIRVHRRAN